ncbi:MAG: fatty acid desaturase [Pseudomonadota bacterium]
MSILDVARPFAVPDNRLAWVNLGISLLFYFGAIVLGTIYWGNWLVLAVSVVFFTSGTIRLFGAQHDCGHYAHFTNRTVCEVVGVLMGAFTAHPFYAMKYNHNRHHAEIGNLDERDAHEVLTWTVREYQDAGFWGKLYYRIYRSPVVIYFIGPVFMFYIRYRIPKNVTKTGWFDVVAQNTLMFSLWYGVYAIGGPTAFTVYMICNLFAACFGTFMVFAGHNFEEAYWEHETECDVREASLQGSSVLDFGNWFHFLTYNFAFHDLHHYYVKIPAYHLKSCHEALKDQLQPTRMGWAEAFACIRWKLWDEDTKRMVRFSDLRQPALLHPAE